MAYEYYGTPGIGPEEYHIITCRVCHGSWTRPGESLCHKCQGTFIERITNQEYQQALMVQENQDPYAGPSSGGRGGDHRRQDRHGQHDKREGRKDKHRSSRSSQTARR